ncbi:MAG: homoserine O- acetyltransferase [Watsoniomyces obsoletus]|nr:MAG: homoserine O- acetyltransferase [Watsoniomyces obsoletus]
MANRPPAALDELHKGLARVKADPRDHLDPKLLDRFRAQLIGPNIAPLIPSLVPELLSVLPTLNQDPEPVTLILRVLLEPLSFTEILDYTGGPTLLVEALRSPLASINLLAVDVLRKAARSPSNTAMVAGMKEVVSELLSVFFLRDTDVSSVVGHLLKDFMVTDFPEALTSVDMGGTGLSNSSEGRARGQGLMWRRWFDDPEIYTIFFTLTSLDVPDPQTGQVDKRQRTVAQARLLDLIPRLASLDLPRLKASHFPEVEARFGLEYEKEGLLDYAVLHMVDTSDDLLMYITLVDFYGSFIRLSSEVVARAGSTPASRYSSPALDYLITTGRHAQTCSDYLSSDASHARTCLEASVRRVRSANYLAIYASTYPDHLLTAKTSGDELLITEVVDFLHQELEEVGTGPLEAHTSYDLHLLVSIPRLAMLPRGADPESEFAVDAASESLPAKLEIAVANEDVLKTLAAIFHGPTEEESRSAERPYHSDGEDWELDPGFWDLEAAAARVLCLMYTYHDPSWVKRVVTIAETIVMTDAALAAIGLITAIITAEWKEAPYGNGVGRHGFILPVEGQVLNVFGKPQPLTGMEFLLQQENFHLVQYLCRPPQTFANLVGGRGDSESAAYRVAVAKNDALRAFHKALRGMPREYNSVKKMVAQALNRPLFGGSEPGAKVATMEM